MVCRTFCSGLMEFKATAINNAKMVERGTVSTQRITVFFKQVTNFLYCITFVKLPKPKHIIKSEQLFDIAGFKFKAVFTPGHSPGSITYIFEEGGFAIVGDTLFENSIGRTDLLGGSMEVLLKSIHEKILILPEDTIIYPGHGSYTTPEQEMARNPFLNGF